MSAPVWSFLGVLVAGLITTLGIVIGRRFDRKASEDAARRAEEQAALTRKLEKQKVDRDDFTAITQQLWRQIESQQEQLSQLREDLDEEKKLRQSADERADAAEVRAQAAEERAVAAEKRALAVSERAAAAAERAEAAEAEVARLRARVGQLEQVLVANHMTVPPPENETPHEVPG